MKKILYLLCSCFAVTLMASCEDFLDKTPQGDKTDQDIFSRFNETESLINRLYFYARAADQPLVHIRFFSDSALTDECEGSSAENGWSNKFNDGDWEPGSQLYTSCNATTNAGACHTFWPKLYEDIRCANVILEGIEKYNTPDSEARPGTLSQRIGEVLFIRAYLHYCVLKSYGECPYVDYTVNPNALPPFERENIHTIVEKICRDCDRGLCPRPGAEPDGSVRPRGERRLPGAEGHGALDRSHAALQRVDAQGRHPATMRRSTSRTTPRVGTPQPQPPRP